MKNVITILSLVLFTTATLQAQSINREKMKRDITILEGVLEELFDAKWQGSGGSAKINRIHISDGDLSWNFNETTGIQGLYLPSHGVLFSISGSKPIIYAGKDNNDDYYFTNGDDEDEQTPVNQETITNRIIDFLKNYGATISQLESKDKITVTYKAEDYKQLIQITDDPSGEFQKNKLPTITVTAKLRDIEAYQADELSNSAFRNRLNISTSTPGSENKTDLKILSNILKTTFEDQENNQFQINSEIQYQMIEGLGALYSFDISYGSILENLNMNSDKLVNVTKILADKVELDSLDFDVSFDSLKAMNVINPSDSAVVIRFDSTYFKKLGEKLKNIEFKLKSISDKWDKTSKEIEEKRKQRRAETQQAFDQFLTELKNTMLNYGGTVNSISPNQHLVMSVNVNTNMDELPDRIVLQVNKSAFEKAGQGNLSHEQAMEQITVREY